MAKGRPKKVKPEEQVQDQETKPKDKKAIVKMVRAQVEKTFGPGIIHDKNFKEISPLPTGSLAVDYVCGTNGIRRGRLVELYGNVSTGKSTLASEMIAETQRRGEIAVLVDAEMSFDPKFAKALGVDVDALEICRPDSAQQGCDITEMYVRSGGVSLIVIDSVAAMTPQQNIEKSSGELTMATRARLWSEFCGKITAPLEKTKTVLVVINQIRQKIGTWAGGETTPGGNAIKFYASYRLDVRRKEILKAGARAYGIRSRITCTKNKCAMPFKSAEIDIILDPCRGIVKEAEIVDFATELGMIEKSGMWYSYGGEKIGQGRDNVIEWLTEHSDVSKKLEKEVRDKIRTLQL